MRSYTLSKLPTGILLTFSIIILGCTEDVSLRTESSNTVHAKEATSLKLADTNFGTLRIENPWVRASIVVGHPTAAYMTIVNRAEMPDKLISVKSPKVGKVSIHRTVSEDGITKMHPVGSITIPARQSVIFEPGGLHIMLMGITESIDEGTSFPLLLRFERAGNIILTVPVLRQAGSRHSVINHDIKMEHLPKM